MEKINIKKPTIFLAGDSTVKTYDSNWFISGWGQFLDLFFMNYVNFIIYIYLILSILLMFTLNKVCIFI